MLNVFFSARVRFASALLVCATVGAHGGTIGSNGTNKANAAAVAASFCGDPYTPIFVIQGSGNASPILGNIVTTEGVVVGDFQGASKLKGFYIQDPTGDGNTASSDGVFVSDGDSPAVDVSIGDRVRVTGTVSEQSNNTQLSQITSVQVCSTGNPLPAATSVSLPQPVIGDLERYEDMLVVFQGTLTVTGNAGLGRFGELVLSSDGRIFQQNNFDRAGSAAALGAASLNQRRYVVLDDGKGTENPDPTPYLDGSGTRRVGDTIAGLTGVLTYDVGEYRVHPISTLTFTSANPRPGAPSAVGSAVRVASFNLQNYFNGNGAGGGFPTTSGASTLAEFNRQRDKIIAAMLAISADAFALTDIENDGTSATSAIQDLVNGLNAAAGAGTYAFRDGPAPGSQSVKNSIIYKPASFTPEGPAANDTHAIWTGRAPSPIAQAFVINNSNGSKYVLVAAEFASRTCSGGETGLEADQGEGQGCNNLQRSLEAEALLDFVQDRQVTTGEARTLVMGDLNSYGEEDPIFRLEDDASDRLADGAGGLIDQVQRFVPAASRYSYQSDHQSGYRDHALASKELTSYVSGATIWHINADEPSILDYNLESKSPAQQALNAGTRYRSSDHDPLIVGLDLPSFATVLGIARSTNDMVISFQAVQGKKYQLERKLDLGAANPPWQSAGLSDLTAASNGQMQFTDPGAVGFGKAFYRVRVIPVP